MLTDLCGRYLIHLLIVFRQLTVSITTLNNCGHHYPNVVFRKVTLSIESHALFWRVTVNHNTRNVFRKLTACFRALTWVFRILTVCSKTRILVFRKLTVCFTIVFLVLGKLMVCFTILNLVFRELTLCWQLIFRCSGNWLYALHVLVWCSCQMHCCIQLGAHKHNLWS